LSEKHYLMSVTRSLTVSQFGKHVANGIKSQSLFGTVHAEKSALKEPSNGKQHRIHPC